jgi:DNA-binding MarR family transcriptional regulator
MAVSKQALNAPLRQLVGIGLISNAASKDNRRRKELRLTASGRKLEQRLTGTQMELLDQVFKDTGREAENGWRDVMQRLQMRIPL